MRPRDWVIFGVVVLAAGFGIVYGTYFVGMRREAIPVSTNQLRVGDCVKGTAGPVLPERVMRARCDGPHYGEVFAILTLPDTQDYPGNDALKKLGDNCDRRFVDYAPHIKERPTFSVAVGYPKAEAWANGDRSVACVAMSKGHRWSSIRDWG